jgi:hypothetical protein
MYQGIFGRNAEIVKCDGNVVNGTLGMKRDTNLQLIEFFLSYKDIREVLICCLTDIINIGFPT